MKNSSSKHYPTRAGQNGRLLGALLLVAVAWAAVVGPLSAEEEAAAIERRIAHSAKYLASDELEGRGLGTKGIDLAADFIAGQFHEAGLGTDLFDGKPLQTFEITTSAQLGEENSAALLGPADENPQQPEPITLRFLKDYSPMSASGSGQFDLPLVFAGYGITGKEEGYDDYAQIDVTGQAVIILRREPQQDNPHSAFNGTEVSTHAFFRRKISNAYEHGAAGIVFCTDEHDIRKNVDELAEKWRQALGQVSEAYGKLGELKDLPPTDLQARHKEIDVLTSAVQTLSEQLRGQFDPVLPFRSADSGESTRDFPIIHCRREPLDRAIAAAWGTSLAELEAKIDVGPTPHSRRLDGWRIAGKIDVARKQTVAKNVVGLLRGEGPLASEAVVVGAHYDHLGFGGHGSLHAGQKVIHNGADDNASGVAALIEIARQLAARPQRLRRSVVFVAFTGEERGLLGSSHYVNHPVIPLEKTVAMLNMDMVGRLREERVILVGTETAPEFGPILDRVNGPLGLNLIRKPGGFSPSDQTVFYTKKIPVLYFFTGTHEHYHKPTDDFERLNIPGIRRVARLVGDAIVELANADGRPQYVALEMPERSQRGTRPYFGSIPDFGREEPGYALSGVTKGGPAEKAGLKGGDIIVQLGESKIANLEDFDSALRKHKAAETVPVVVSRDGQQQTFEITLEPPR